MKYEKKFRKGRRVLWTKSRWVTDHNGLDGQGKDLGDFYVAQEVLREKSHSSGFLCTALRQAGSWQEWGQGDTLLWPGWGTTIAQGRGEEVDGLTRCS